MRYFKFSSLFVLFSFVFFAACNDNEMELNKGNDVLTLSKSTDVVDLNPKNPNVEAITFKWTSGSNFGTGSFISYVFQMNMDSTDWSSGVNIDMGRQIYSKTYTVNEMNRVLLEDLALSPGQTVTLAVRVIAQVANQEELEQVSEIITFQATAYKPYSQTLYILGSASPNGWSADQATPMNPISGEAGGFVWIGQLNTGEFKFITNLGSFLPSYNKGETENQLLFRESDNQPDDKFTINKGGRYKVQINILDLTITITLMDGGVRFTNIYFVGSFNNWSFEPMIQDAVNPNVFKLGREMNWNGGGDFKFGSVSGSWDKMIHPTIANAPYTHTQVMFDDTGDYKWVLTQAECNKPYKMILDVTEGSEKFTMKPFVPYTSIWMVGSATPNGWDLGNSTALIPVEGNPYKFTWTGILNSGELKFSLDRKSDWSGAWFLASEGGLVPNGNEQQMIFSLSGDGGKDNKWQINDAGSYKIELDQLKELVKITKQ